MLCEYRPQNDKDVMSMNTQKVFDSIVNIDDVLEVITFSSDNTSPVNSSSGASSPIPNPATTKSATDSTSTQKPVEVDLLDLSDFSSLPVPSPTTPSVSVDINSHQSAQTAPTETSATPAPGKKKLAANIHVRPAI